MKQHSSSVAFVVSLAVVVVGALLPASPSIYPTGTTIYDPERTWSGYTVFDTPDQQGAVLIDMNGRKVKRWPDIASAPGPFRVLPGGYLLGGTVQRRPHQEAVALAQVDWDGNVVWKSVSET